MSCGNASIHSRSERLTQTEIWVTCRPYLLRRKVNNAVDLLVGAALASSCFRGRSVVQEGLPSRRR